MKITDIEIFLKKTEEFVVAPEDDKLVERFMSIRKLAYKIGFLTNYGNDRHEVIAARDRLRTDMHNLVHGKHTRVYLPGTTVEAACPPDGRGFGIETTSANVCDLSYTVFLVMVMGQVKGITICPAPNCGKYIFQTHRRKKFCNDNCRQRTHQRTKKAKTTRQTRYYKKKGENNER